MHMSLTRAAPALWVRYLIVAGMLVACAALARVDPRLMLAGVIGGALVVVLLREPRWGLAALPAVCLFVGLSLGTGSEVSLNVAVLAIPALAGTCLVRSFGARQLGWAPSRLNRPLLAFLVVSLLSLARGHVFWDPLVPQPANLLLVQAGQLAIYVLSFIAFWLSGTWITGELWLRRLAYGYVAAVALATVGMWAGRAVPGLRSVLPSGLHSLVAVWAVALALSGVLHDSQLGSRHRRMLLATVGVVLAWMWLMQLDWMGSWAPTFVAAFAVAVGNPGWSRALAVAGGAFAALRRQELARLLSFSVEWEVSGVGRLVLWEAVLRLGMRSPLLGLGPAAYRHYHHWIPLVVGGAYYLHPNVSAHNQFVDLFGQMGVLGVGCYIWFLIEAFVLARRLYMSRSGFAKAYSGAAMAALLAGALADMTAEVTLPFVYNMGFGGFRYSVLGWMLLGGLVALDREGHEDA